MEIHILFMQRKEGYKGEFGPEALIAWDEYSVHENPSGFDDAVENAKLLQANQSAGFALVKVSIDGDKVRKMCLPAEHRLEGEVTS